MRLLEGKKVVLWASKNHLAQECRADLFRAALTLARLGCRVQAVFSQGELRELLSELAPDLIVASLCCGFQEPLDLLEQVGPEAAGGRVWEQCGAFPPVLLMADAHDLPLYLEGMRRGAFDCLGLPFEENELIRLAAEALGARPEAVGTRELEAAL